MSISRKLVNESVFIFFLALHCLGSFGIAIQILSLAGILWSRLVSGEWLVVPVPDGPSFWVAQHEGVVSFHYFPHQEKIGVAVFHFGAGHGDLVPLGKTHAHVVQKGFRAQVNVDGVRAILYLEVGNLLLAALWRELYFLHRALDLGLCLDVVLWKTCGGRLFLLGVSKCSDNGKECD